MENRAAFGIYRTKKQVSLALEILEKAGFCAQDIWIKGPYNVINLSKKPKGFAHQLKTKVGLGAKIGAAMGLITGLVIGFVASNSDSILVITFSSLFGALFGASSGALVGIGTPERAAYRYLGYVGSGGILLSIHIEDSDREKTSLRILKATGAEEISEEDESHMRHFFETHRPLINPIL